MHTLKLAAVLFALAAASPVLAADYALLMPTGAVVSCDAIESVQFQDMRRFYGMNNFSKEYEQYTRFRTLAPRDCARAEHRAALAAQAHQESWLLVATTESAKPAR